MTINAGELAIYQKQFREMMEALDDMDGLTVLGFALTVVTAENGLGLLFGGDVDIRSAAIDVLSSHHHCNITGQDEIEDLIENAMAKKN